MVEGDEEGPKKLDHPAHTSEKRISSVTMIKLDIKDPLITKTGNYLITDKLLHMYHTGNSEIIACTFVFVIAIIKKRQKCKT